MRERFFRITHLDENEMNSVVQGSAKRRALGCVNSPPAARGSQEAGFTQPRDHLLADPCTTEFILFSSKCVIRKKRSHVAGSELRATVLTCNHPKFIIHVSPHTIHYTHTGTGKHRHNYYQSLAKSLSLAIFILLCI